ncbi:hypothetical protein C8J57DRAFT_1324604 [Mycena rebaudengoi]|nr:hypothetical protein C8J57DRAFT_1324604 [Mycena rebaudengoi]
MPPITPLARLTIFRIMAAAPLLIIFSPANPLIVLSTIQHSRIPQRLPIDTNFHPRSSVCLNGVPRWTSSSI